jgi:DNA-binding transcriptional LysR family regulator
MDLAHLETFLAIYRHGNLSRAAEDLHLSQPAVSNHLKALESYLGRQLFVRRARGVVATPLADSIAHDITAPMQSLNATIAAYAIGADQIDTTLYIGGPADALSTRVIPALLPLVAQGLIVHAATGNTKALLTRLADGELDLVIATTPSRTRGVRLDRLFTETLALIASRDWAQRLPPPLTAHALYEAPMVAYAENLQLIRRYWRTVFKADAPPTPRIVLDDIRGIISAVVAGAGWSVVPTYLALNELTSGALHILHQPDEPPTNTLYLATATGRANPAIRLVAALLHIEAQAW